MEARVVMAIGGRMWPVFASAEVLGGAGASAGPAAGDAAALRAARLARYG